MIVNPGVTRMKICPRIFILLLTLFPFKSVICVSGKESLNENSYNCGGEYYGDRYTIGSPNYPENYPASLDCDYILRGNQHDKCTQVFNLEFLDFALPPSENCQKDYLEIGERNLYCGSVVGIRKFPGKNNSLTLRFHSSAQRIGKGFKILVTTLPCEEPPINKYKTNFTESSATRAIYKATTKNLIDKKIGTLNNPETIELLEAENFYPTYHPEIDFTDDDNRQPERGDQSPLKIESFGKNENNIVTSKSNSANSLDFAVRHGELLSNSKTTKVAIVTPTPVKLEENLPKVSAYLFVPSSSEQNSKDTLTSTKYSSNESKVSLNNKIDNFITPPPTEFTLPGKWRSAFRDIELTNDTRQFGLIEDQRKINQKFVVPARSYGVPTSGLPYYPAVKVSQSDVNIASSNADCQEKNNFQSDVEVASNFREIIPTSIDNTGLGLRSNYYPATTYGTPGLSYPTNVGNVNVGFTPSPRYGPPVGNNPNEWLANGNLVPSSGIPTNNVGNRYPNNYPNSGSIGGYSQCCKTEYSAQRFYLASPGFPSLFYSRNPYDCIYSIKPYSSNICQIRFNLQFFNHGTDDNFCTNGYVEIDGRRICGCKRALSIVSPVFTIFPKAIRVSYTGYPRTKFNGFLIQVIQEPCTNSYPYVSRSKKDVGNSINDTNYEGISRITNSSIQRTKRNLGYTYPKPNFGLNEEPSVSQTWNSGNSINTEIHQLLNNGEIGANLFAPISTCQVLSFIDWINAAKDVYLRGARCFRNGGSGGNVGYPVGWIPGQSPGYPGGGGTGSWNPGYPGSGGSGSWNPGYPGSGGSGSWNPGYPGNGGPGSSIPGYPGGPGSSIPNYPGGSGSNIPSYPGGPGSSIPNYPGGSGSNIPSYPGGPGSSIPNYPGGSGSNIPSYPGGPGSSIPNYPGGSGSSIPGYPGSGGWNVPSSKCEDVNVIEGIISSPQYPTNYPNNVNKCFRFHKAPQHCRLEVAFLDFDLENSRGCTKDYVAFSGQNRRYCGRSLAGSSSLIDISRANFIDMYFVSDGYGSGRGFSAGFSQIAC